MSLREAEADWRAVIARYLMLLVVVVALIWAPAPHSYDYYTLLRWLTFGVCGYQAMLSLANRMPGVAWTFAMIALLYNPFLPVHLKRATWNWVNVVTTAIILLAMLVSRPGTQRSNDE